MGGPGSGFHSRGSRYLAVEQCYDLDIADLARAGYFSRPGYKAAATWSWTSSGGGRDGEVTMVKVEIDLTAGQTPTFAILYGLQEGDAEREPVAVRGELMTTTPHYGGVRYWFRCPRSWHRVRVLYAYPARGRERFSCRYCQGLRYYSERESRSDRLLRRARKHYRLAGSPDGREPWEWAKPKWIRWATFRRHLVAGQDAADTADGMILHKLGIAIDHMQGRGKW